MSGPDVHDERVLELRARGLDVQPRVAWRRNGPVLAVVFFVLTAGAIASFAGYLHLLLQLEKVTFWFIAGACLLLAEYLIRAHRMFGTGVESALWLGGLFSLVFGFPGDGSVDALLLFALAAAGAGFRMRNGLYGAVAAGFVIGYAVAKGEFLAAAAIAVAISMAALVALRREWQRPSTEMLWVALLVIPPIVAAAATLTELPAWWAVVWFAAAIACGIAGIIWRAHAPLIAALVYAVIAAVAAHDLLPFAPEWSLILGGGLLLAGSGLVARELRHEVRGVVVSPDALTRFDEEMQILATIAAQPRVDAPAPGGGEGGRFGGAGATGDY